MITGILISMSAGTLPGQAPRFEVYGSSALTLSDARAEAEGEDTKFIDFIQLEDGTDAGLRAFAAVLALAIQADDNVEGVALEDLLTKVFTAGVKFGREKPA